MAQELTADALRPHVAVNPGLIREALAELYSGDARRISLDAVQVSAAVRGRDVADLLVESLKTHGTDRRFLSILRGLGLPILVVPPANVAFDHKAMAKFASESWAFRCRIRVNGQVVGSGALVSARLVLTAAHVIETALAAATEQNPARIEIVASDTQVYPARNVFLSPCHPDEHTGFVPPLPDAEEHADVALLRIDVPLGLKYSHITLPEKPLSLHGPAGLVLVHFPDGQDEGFLTGTFSGDSVHDPRLPHDIMAAPGSSGGPGFDNKFNFVGIHQGKFFGAGANTHRIVPYNRFAQNGDFRKVLENDNPPRRLWSLDGTLDSHLIIGRELFFQGLSAIVESSPATLRGLWVRRMDPEESASGLSFSHDILAGFLRAHRNPHRLCRIPMSLSVTDLDSHVRGIVGGGAAPGAVPGVAPGQTTDVAHDDDRMRRLADTLDQVAAAAGHTLWLYVDNPPAGLLTDTQIQLEHLVAALVTRPNLRVVIAGYETIALLNDLSESIENARRLGRPNVLVEFIGHFRRADVESTVREMSRALDLGWSSDIVTFVVNLALNQLQPNATGAYPPAMFSTVSTQLRDFARTKVGG